MALGVSRTQVYRLIELGRLETGELDGARWPTIRGLVAYDDGRDGRSGPEELGKGAQSSVTLRNGGVLSRRQGVTSC